MHMGLTFVIHGMESRASFVVFRKSFLLFLLLGPS